MESDNVSESEHDWKVLESLGVDDNRGVVAALGASVEAGIDDFQGADVELFVDLVGEGGIDDHTVDVLGVSGGEGSLGELSVVVSGSSLGLLGSLGWGGGLLSGFRSWHCF